MARTHRPPFALQLAGHVHEAAEVAREQRLGPGRGDVRRLRLDDGVGDVGILHAERPAEAAADISAGELDQLQPAHGAQQLARLPLHAEYDEQIKGRYADIVNSPADRGAGGITAAQFLKRFAGDAPWAHLDIAGTAYDNKKPYTPNGGAGFGVRTLVELAKGA